MSRLHEFRESRERVNSRTLDDEDLVTNCLFALDTKTYEPRALDAETKLKCLTMVDAEYAPRHT
jgi:hypothetical protein